MAIGLLAVGSGIGFFLGPQYAGWRPARRRGWTIGAAAIANWRGPAPGSRGGGARVQHPVSDGGARGGGAVVASAQVSAPPSPNGNGRASKHGEGEAPAEPGDVVTAAREDARPPARGRRSRPLGPVLRRRLLGVSLTLMCRDFAGIASLTLASIYLQKAHNLSTKHTGFIVGEMMLIGVIVNPLCVYLSPGKRRLPALAAVLASAGFIVLAVPLVSVRWVLPVLCLFQACHLGSYAISEAAMLKRVDPAVRGHMIGLFLSVAGTFASTAPWVMGYWTDAMGDAARRPLPYLWPFGLVGAVHAARRRSRRRSSRGWASRRARSRSGRCRRRRRGRWRWWGEPLSRASSILTVSSSRSQPSTVWVRPSTS